MTTALAWLGAAVLWGLAPVADPSPDPSSEPASDVSEQAAPPDSMAPPPTPDPEAPTGGTGALPAADGEVDDAAALEAEAATEEPVEPAVLPENAPKPPEPAEPGAWGGAYDVPLPKAPKAEDPAGLSHDPWRGRFWLDLGLQVSVPVGGRAPAAGMVVAPVPELSFGWRIRPFVGLHTSISNFAHDAALTVVTDGQGNEARDVVHGRITAFDLLTARFYVPRPRRLEPWAEVGAGIGARRGPLESKLDAAGLIRVGAGLDLWLAPTFSLAPIVAYRVIIIDQSVGHGLRVGLDLGIHW